MRNDYFGKEGDDELADRLGSMPLWLHVAVGVFLGALATVFTLYAVWGTFLYAVLSRGMR